MTGWSFRSRSAWIIPLVLLIVALLEELAAYKVRQRVADLRLRVALIVALNAFAFTVAAAWLAPRMKDLLAGVRKKSVRTGGDLGLWLFYAAAYGALIYAYWVAERHGIQALLPRAWR